MSGINSYASMSDDEVLSMSVNARKQIGDMRTHSTVNFQNINEIEMKTILEKQQKLLGIIRDLTEVIEKRNLTDRFVELKKRSNANPNAKNSIFSFESAENVHRKIVQHLQNHAKQLMLELKAAKELGEQATSLKQELLGLKNNSAQGQDDLKNKLASVEKQWNICQNDLIDRTKQIEKLQQQLNEAEQARGASQTRASAAESKFNETKGQLNESVAMKEQIAKLQEEIAKLKSDLSAAGNSTAQLKEIREKLEKTEAEMKIYRNAGEDKYQQVVGDLPYDIKMMEQQYIDLMQAAKRSAQEKSSFLTPANARKIVNFMQKMKMDNRSELQQIEELQKLRSEFAQREQNYQTDIEYLQEELEYGRRNGMSQNRHRALLEGIQTADYGRRSSQTGVNNLTHNLTTLQRRMGVHDE
jgi:chromosome segregation ATPase